MNLFYNVLVLLIVSEWLIVSNCPAKSIDMKILANFVFIVELHSI